MKNPKPTYLPAAWVDDACPQAKFHPNEFLHPAFSGWQVIPSELDSVLDLGFSIALGDVIELVKITDFGWFSLETSNETGLIPNDDLPEDVLLFVDGITDDGGCDFEEMCRVYREELKGDFVEGDLIEVRAWRWQFGHRAVLVKDDEAHLGAKLELLPFNEFFQGEKAGALACDAACELVEKTEYDWGIVLLGRHDPAKPNRLPVSASFGATPEKNTKAALMVPDIIEKVFDKPCCAETMRKDIQELDG